MYLKIENPCHENWEQMTPMDRSRFCEVCQKKVHDLTSASIDEIYDLHKKQEGVMCGRVNGKLLNEQFVAAQLKMNQNSLRRNFFLATVICFGSFLFSIQSSLAGNLDQLKDHFLIQQDSIQELKISGVVRDKLNKELLPFCNVMLMTGDSVIAITNTDLDGKFSLNINAQKFPQFDLKVQYVGYNSLQIKNIKPDKKELVFELEAQPAEIMGLFIIEEMPPSPDPFFRGKTVSGDEYRRMPK